MERVTSKEREKHNRTEYGIRHKDTDVKIYTQIFNSDRYLYIVDHRSKQTNKPKRRRPIVDVPINLN